MIHSHHIYTTGQIRALWHGHKYIHVSYSLLVFYWWEYVVFGSWRAFSRTEENNHHQMKTRVARCSRIQAAVHISPHRLQAAQLKSENLKKLETLLKRKLWLWGSVTVTCFQPCKAAETKPTKLSRHASEMQQRSWVGTIITPQSRPGHLLLHQHKVL